MSRKLILASAMTMILAGTDATALGLGGIRTLSVLNQPFSGEIDLTDVKPDELDAIKVAIASQEAFDKSGLERYYYLTKLVFTPQMSQGKPVIRVSSREPIREPYMDLLVEAYWSTGQLTKEYTILLDPPVPARRRPPPVATPVAGSVPAAGARTVAGASSATASGDGFPLFIGPIQAGDGLWRLARNHAAAAGATVAQTAMALYRNNQHAFVRGNIDRLILGKTLVIPTRAELFALDAGAAEQDFAAALRGGAARRAPLTEIPPETLSSRLRIAGATPESSQTVAPDAAQMRQEPPATGSPRLEQNVLRALENSESTRQEALELRERIRELETQLADIQNLLQQRNAEFARIQGSEATPAVADENLPGDNNNALISATVTDVAPVPGVLTTAPSQPVETSSAPGVTEPPPETPATPPPTLLPVPKPVADAAPEPGIRQTAPAAASNPARAADAPESAATWRSLMLPLAGFAGLAGIAMLAFAWIAARRRRLAEAGVGAPDEAYRDNDVFLPAHLAQKSGHGAAAGEDAKDSHAVTSMFNAKEYAEDSTPLSLISSLEEFDAETDEADVLSEADIYIAYGRHSEAQDLLRKEMERYPKRLDIQFKLADAYAGAKDSQGLKDLLQKIKSAGGDREQPEQWRRLRELSDRMAGSGMAGSGETGDGRADALAGDRKAESLAAGDSDSLFMDVDEIQRASARTTVPAQENPANFAKSAPENLAKPAFVHDALGDLLSESTSQGDLVLDNDSFELALPLYDSDEKSDSQRDPFADLAPPKRTTAADSELVLTLGDTRLKTAEDRNAAFDSRPQVSHAGALDSALAPEAESLPTEQLTSQWQMDSGVWDETATKLDLARAYLEMDDADAAREILQEVMAEGREEQQTEARTLLAKLT